MLTLKYMDKDINMNVETKGGLQTKLIWLCIKVFNRASFIFSYSQKENKYLSGYVIQLRFDLQLRFFLIKIQQLPLFAHMDIINIWVKSLRLNANFLSTISKLVCNFFILDSIIIIIIINTRLHFYFLCAQLLYWAVITTHTQIKIYKIINKGSLQFLIINQTFSIKTYIIHFSY